LKATPPNPSINWRVALFLFLAVFAFSIPQAALLPLVDRDEPRFAEAAREMLQSGNYVVPTFNGVPRYDKPPLIYWCQAASFVFLGENAFAARLPSLLATAATAALIYTWGVRLGREWIGLAAGLSYAFCLQTIQQGRVATADALLIFFMTLTAFTGWLIVHPKSDTRAPLACYIILALGFAGGFLAKGPEAWLPLLALLWCGRGARVGIIISFLAGVALMLLWGVPAYVETNGDFLWRSWKAGIADRAWGADQGHGASNIGIYLLELPYYVVAFWLSALPWSVLIALRAKKLFSGWKLDFADTYLLLNIVPLVLIFTLMATKLPHYTLPAFPMIALLFARRWVAAELSAKLPIRLAAGFGLGLALVALVGIPMILADGGTPSPVGELVRAAGADLKPDTQFALVDFKEPTAIWEMRHVARAYAQPIDDLEIASFFAQPGPRALISTSDAYFPHAASGNDIKIYPVHGFNAAKGHFVNLVLIVRP
jgi:4-amino-4-deoxy-L-arabinose transferase-like glycosyltransferase